MIKRAHLSLSQMLAYLRGELEPSCKKQVEDVLEKSPMYAMALEELKDSLKQGLLRTETIEAAECTFMNELEHQANRLKVPRPAVSSHKPKVPASFSRERQLSFLS